MMTMVGVHSLNERLFNDESTKDVEIELSDGELKAHSVVLMVASEAFRAILSNGVAATANPKRLSWREHKKTVGQFFLRLLYTGTLEESEWSDIIEIGENDAAAPEMSVCGDNNFEIIEIPKQLQSAPLEDPSIIDIGEIAGEYHMSSELKCNGLPVWQQKVGGRQLHVTGTGLWVVSGPGRISPEARGRGAKSFLASVSSNLDGPPHRFNEWNYKHRGKWVQVQIKLCARQPAIPIQLLSGSLQLAKMYEVHDLLSPLMATVQKYLTRATFNCVSQLSIKSDIQLLRMRCLQFAEDESNNVRELYDTGKLAPEVKAELVGMWLPHCVSEKRRRTL